MTFNEWYEINRPFPGDSRDLKDAWDAALENLQTIYQIFSHAHSSTECWEDVPYDFYARTHPSQRRIVYAAPDSSEKKGL